MADPVEQPPRYIPRHLIWHAGSVGFACDKTPRCQSRGKQDAEIVSVGEGEVTVVCRSCEQRWMIGGDCDPAFIAKYGPEIREKLTLLKARLDDWFAGGIGLPDFPPFEKGPE